MVGVAVLTSSVLLAGCAGGTETTTTPTPTPTTGTTAGATTSTQLSEFTPSTLSVRSVQAPPGMYPDEFAVNIKFTPNSDTPAFFVNALRQKKPIFVEFYAEGDAITDAMVLGIDELQAQYRDRVVFLLLNGDRPQTYGGLPQQLPLTYTPQVLIFNRDGTIIRSFSGYVDKDRLEQGIYDAINRGY